MKSFVLALAAILILSATSGSAQINDCAGAVVLCNSESIGFNPIGPGMDDFADPDNIPGCIVSLEQNSAWYYFQIDPNAPPNLVLGFTITPLGGFGEDYDWALFGPNVECGDLGAPIRCSSSSAQCGFCPETGMGMGTTDVTEGPGTGDGFVMTLVVQPGQGFYLLIDNWQGTNNGFVLSWTESAADYLNCEASPPCALSAIAGQDLTACSGDTGIQLNGGASGNHGGETYSWSGTNGGTAFLSDPGIPNPTVDLPQGFTGTITYTLTVVEDTCTGIDELNLVVHPLPAVSITPVDPLCANDPPHTLTGTPSGGMWGGAASGNTFDPMLNGPGIHTVSYTYEDGNDCTATAYLDIEVYAIPDIAIDPSPAQFCDDEGSVLLTAEGSGGAGGFTYAWMTPSGPGSDNTFDATLSGIHAVTVTDANGCSNMTSTMVMSYPNPTVEIVDPGPICTTLPTFTMTAVPPGGEWDGTIIDPSGEFYPVMVGPGSYSVTYTYTDENGCDGSDAFTITIIPTPSSEPYNNGPVCEGQPILLFGQTDGTGSVITYAWSGPNGYASNAQNPTDATGGGTYILEVTVDGCPSMPATTVVSVLDAPEAQATNSGPYCNGETIELFGSSNASGPNVAFSWSGPNGYASSAQNPTDATEPGIYTLTVTNGTCPSVNAQTEVIFGTPPDAVAANTGPYCAGEAIELMGTTSASGSQITYTWTGPNGFQSADQNPTNAMDPGTYQLIVSVDGCLSMPGTTDVIVHPAPQPAITGQDTICAGTTTVLDGGAGYTTYAWSDGSSAQTLLVSMTGAYGLTVSDGNGCSGADTLAVTQLPTLVPVISGATDFCAGSATSLDAGAGYAAYAWSTGETSSSITVTSSGTFSITVTDAQGCTGRADIIATAHPAPVVTITGSTTYCIGGYTVLDAGPGYVAYQWSDGSTGQTLTVAAPGPYTVDVVDVRGCTGSASVTVIESTSLSPVITGLPAFCAGGSTVLDAGAGFLTYGWSDGSSAQTLTVSAAGTYALTVSDGQGCSGTAEVAVTEIQPPSATLQPGATVCNTIAGGSVVDLYGLILAGDMNGTWADADASGAAGPFTALDFNAVSPGLYRFTYTTNSAVAPCTESTYEVVVTVLDCACPDVVFGVAGPLCNEGDVLDLSTVVQSAEPGTWSITQAPPGTSPAALAGNDLNVTGADAGDYTLLFTLVNAPPPGCPADYTLVVHVDDAVSAGTAVAPVGYCADETAVVRLTDLIAGEDAGGLWTERSAVPSTGGAFNAANGTFAVAGQAPGTYAFEYALAASGACPGKAATVTVIVHPLPVAVIAVPDVLDCANPMLRLDASGSSSGADFAIAWTGPGIVADGQENTLRPTVDQAGTYQLTITHVLTGCAATASVAVAAMTDPPSGAVVESQDPACFGSADGSLSVLAVDGGTPPYRYSLAGGPWSADGTFEPLSAGDYTLLLEDANGCRWDTVITLSEPAAIAIDLGPDLSIGLGDSASVQATVVLGSSPMDTVLWSPANMVYCQDASCLQVGILAANSGPLQATLVDENGCTATDRILITLDKDRRIYIPNAFSPNGDGINDRFFVTGDPDQVTRVKSLRIYDRWGSEIYAASDFGLGDPDIFWDGRFRNDPLNPGVFTYFAEIEFIDGVVVPYRGDVTMLR